MTLKYPGSDVPFVVGPAYFLGDFDVYDREETLGVRLDKFNPNNKSHLRLALDEYFFNGARVANLSPAHKIELIRALAHALAEDSFNFSTLVTDDWDPDDYFTLPDSWIIEEPRSFFVDIYDIAIERWKNDLELLQPLKTP